MIFRFLVCLAVCFFLTGQVSAQAQSGGDYSIAVGDRLDISVLEDPTLNRQTLVRPDGKISMPLVGTISVAGKTTEAVQGEIRKRLGASFVSPPSVTVALFSIGEIIDESASSPVPAFYVLGEVREPGRYTFDEEKPVTVLQALSVAGGLDVFAARKRVQVRRYADGVETVLVFDYKAVESGKASATPLVIKDGDVIVVPERGLFK